jgi:hypothetical protein
MLGGLPIIYGIDPYHEEANPSHVLGSLGITADGRKFRYAKAGASALVAGDAIQSPAEVTANESLTPTAAGIGSTEITITTGAAVTANAYANGYMVCTNTPSNGLVYKIKSHPANSGATTCVFTLYEPLIVALTSSSRVDLVFDPYNGVIQNPATATGGIVGVALKAITASYYGWVQSGGVCAVLAGGTVGVGKVVVANQGTAASVIVGANTATEAFPILGRAVTSGTNGENCAVFLQMD